MDIIAYPDPLGTSSPHIKVQVKRRQATVGVGGRRDAAFAPLVILSEAEGSLRQPIVSTTGVTRVARID